MQQKKILGIGSALVDILTQIPNDQILKDLNLPKGGMIYVDAKTSVEIGEKALCCRQSIVNILFRNNAVYAMIFLIPVCLVFLKGGKKKIMTAALILVTIAAGMCGKTLIQAGAL